MLLLLSLLSDRHSLSYRFIAGSYVGGICVLSSPKPERISHYDDRMPSDPQASTKRPNQHIRELIAARIRHTNTTTKTCVAYGTRTWYASKYKVHKLHHRNILKMKKREELNGEKKKNMKKEKKKKRKKERRRNGSPSGGIYVPCIYSHAR